MTKHLSGPGDEPMGGPGHQGVSRRGNDGGIRRGSKGDRTGETNGSLRSLYEAPQTTLASGAERALRQLRMIEPVLDSARHPLRILDIGCGDGAATALLARRAAGHTVIGADWSVQALNRARERGLAVLRGGIDDPGLPLPDRSLDMVVFSEVIEHLVDTDRALEEIVRVLRPGGSLLLSTPNLAAWFNRVLLMGGVQPLFTEVSLRAIHGRPGREVVGHLRVFTRRALLGLLSAHGLETVAVRGAGYHDTPRVLRPLDRLLRNVPSLAADLLVHARTPVPSEPVPEASMPISAPLHDMLACPVDKGPLLYDPQGDTLYNPRLRRRYPIVDGVPHLLADQADTVSPQEHAQITRSALARDPDAAAAAAAENPAGTDPRSG
jgi:SAM-dependent methyltransferase